jgi:hypothetical protein
MAESPAVPQGFNELHAKMMAARDRGDSAGAQRMNERLMAMGDAFDAQTQMQGGEGVDASAPLSAAPPSLVATRLPADSKIPRALFPKPKHEHYGLRTGKIREKTVDFGNPASVAVASGSHSCPEDLLDAKYFTRQ